MRIKSEPRYILTMTVTFQDFEAAEAFQTELAANEHVHGLNLSGRVVKYHTFDRDQALSLANNFETKWIEEKAAREASKRIESSDAGMIRYGDVTEETPIEEQPAEEPAAETPSE